MESEDTKFLSRKFILTVVVILLCSGLPLAYQKMGISEDVTLAVLALLGSVGAAYGFMNIAEAKHEILSKLTGDEKDEAPK